MSEQINNTQPELCYCREGDDACVRDLQSLIDVHELEVGDVYTELDLVQPPPSYYFDIDNLLENMAAAADGEAGEHADGFPDLSDEDKAELNQLIGDWLDKKLTVDFFTAINPREKTITADDLGVQP
jgi:hypothetical protein